MKGFCFCFKLLEVILQIKTLLTTLNSATVFFMHSEKLMQLNIEKKNYRALLRVCFTIGYMMMRTGTICVPVARPHKQSCSKHFN